MKKIISSVIMGAVAVGFSAGIALAVTPNYHACDGRGAHGIANAESRGGNVSCDTGPGPLPE